MGHRLYLQTGGIEMTILLTFDDDLQGESARFYISRELTLVEKKYLSKLFYSYWVNFSKASNIGEFKYHIETLLEEMGILETEPSIPSISIYPNEYGDN